MPARDTAKEKFSQNSVSKKFVQQLKVIIDGGGAGSYNEIADKIGWNKTSMSSVVNGARNVPIDIYKRFAAAYHLEVSANVDNPNEFISNRVLRIEAKQDAILIALAEVIAYQKKKPVAGVLADLVKAANLQGQKLVELL